ncbi:MAG: class I SAM-dependent methyltransferase [Pseudomonadota bacterium]
MSPTEELCPVCDNTSRPFDVVDFNKSCQEANGKFLALAGQPVYYFVCEHCGFCFAPEFSRWTNDEFLERIYNDRYIDFDPDYVTRRPLANANKIDAMFGGAKRAIRHLDYGGGNGLLAQTLVDRNWHSESFDEFVDPPDRFAQLGKYDLITVFEVFEHVVDVKRLMSQLRTLRAENGIIYFSTLLSDGQITRGQRLSWWYAAPRNGHISLFSKASLVAMCEIYRLNLQSFNAVNHVFYTSKPDWAASLLGAAS